MARDSARFAPKVLLPAILLFFSLLFLVSCTGAAATTTTAATTTGSSGAPVSRGGSATAPAPASTASSVSAPSSTTTLRVTTTLSPTTTTSLVPPPTGADLRALAKRISKSIMWITVSSKSGGRVQTTKGSGLAYESEGLVLTISDLVAPGGTNATGIMVTLPSGVQKPGTVVGRDPAAGLALVRIGFLGLSPITLADGTPVPGDQVLLAGDLTNRQATKTETVTGIDPAGNLQVQTAAGTAGLFDGDGRLVGFPVSSALALPAPAVLASVKKMLGQ